MAVEDASFKTTNVSMSFGLIKFKGFLEPPTPPLSKGIPSITYSGWLVNDKEPVPRILIDWPSSGF